MLLKTGAAALALPSFGLTDAPAARSGSCAAASGADRAGALVAHAPELLRGRHAANALCGAAGPARHLRAAGLAGFALGGAGGHGPDEARLATVRKRIGDRQLGLIWWGGAPPTRLVNDAVAVVLIDQIAVADGLAVSECDMLCHFASRRSTNHRRAIERQLAAVERAGNPVIYHWYDAEPGFAAPGVGAAGERRDPAADLVWRRTAWFLGRALAQPAWCGLPGAAYGGLL